MRNGPLPLCVTGSPKEGGPLYLLVARSSHEDLPQLRRGSPMPNLISWGWQLRGNIPLASERFRSVPRTLRPLFGRLIVRRSMRVVCAPEEIRHERAGCSGETAFGFRHRWGRALFDRGSPGHASMGLRSRLTPATG